MMWADFPHHPEVSYTISLSPLKVNSKGTVSFSSSLPIFDILASCQLIHHLKDIWTWIMPEQEDFCFSRLRHWVELYKTGVALLLDRVGRDGWARQEIPTELWYPGRKKNSVIRPMQNIERHWSCLPLRHLAMCRLDCFLECKWTYQSKASPN